MAARTRTMHSLVLPTSHMGWRSIDDRLSRVTRARRSRFHSGRPRQRSLVFWYSRRGGRIHARNTGERAQKGKILRMIRRDERRGRLGRTRRDATVEFVRASRPLQRGCRTTDVNPRMGGMKWVKRGGERERDSKREWRRERARKRERERRVAEGKRDGREYYGERRRTKERRRGAAPFSRGSIDASASFVDFRAENADARGRSGVAKGWWRTRETRGW